MPIYQFLDVALCHITEKDWELLCSLPVSRPPHASSYDCGAYIPAPSMDILENFALEELEETGFSAEFRNLLVYAAKENCFLLRLDRDADMHSDLKVFDTP